MSYFREAASNFLQFANEFGVLAPFRIFRNNRSAGELKSLMIKGYPASFYYRQNSTDLPILRLIIGQKRVFRNLQNPKLIIDAGANVGYVSVFYAKHFPGATIHAIEMELLNYEMLLRNTAVYKNIRPIQAALWEHSNGISFSSQATTDSYSVVDNKTADRNVPSITLTDVLKAAGTETIDLLKLDIEGAELEILNWMKVNRVEPRALMVELHDRFRPGCSAALESFLEGKTYRRSKIYEYEIIEFSR